MTSITRQINRPRVFISSTFKNLLREREYVAQVCRGMGLEPRIFPEYSIPGTTTRSYIREVQSCDILIYLVTRESRFVDEEIRLAQARGKPIVYLAEERLLGGGLQGITDEAVRLMSGSANIRPYRSLRELRSAVRDGLSYVLAERFASPSDLQKWSADAYGPAQAAVEQANIRLGLVQQTSSLILGARHDRRPIETRLVTAMHDLIDDVLDPESPRDVAIVHLFDAGETRAEFASGEYPGAIEAVAWLKQRFSKIQADDRITIAGLSAPLTATLIHDNSFLMSTVLKDHLYLWLREVGGAAADLWEFLQAQVEDGEGLADYLDQLTD